MTRTVVAAGGGSAPLDPASLIGAVPIEPLWSEATGALLAAAFVAHPGGSTKAPKTRPHWRIRLITAGRGELRVGQARFSLAPGAVLCTPPGVADGGRFDARDPLRYYRLSGAVRVLGTAVPDALAPLPPLLRPQPEVWGAAVSEAAAICRELEQRRAAFALLANAGFARLVALLWREASEQGLLRAPPAGGGAAAPAAPATASARRVAGAVAHIVACYGDDLTLADLAGAAGLSRTHFSTAFRQATGLAPFDYLRRVRLRRAKELLAASDTPIERVAHAVGFADRAYFSRAFRRSEGVSPLQYRRAKQSPHNP